MKSNMEYSIYDVVELRKGHPCGANEWQIIRLGMDIRLKCQNCGRSIMVPRLEFNRKLKKILRKSDPEE